MKSKLELLEELIAEKQKQLIQLSLKKQERDKLQSFSSFGINASALNEEVSTIRELTGELDALRAMHEQELQATGKVFVGTKAEITEFLSKQSDSDTFRIILLNKEGITKGS